MDVPDALKWTLVYRAIATGSFLLGFALIVVGVVVGVGDVLAALAADPTDPGAAEGGSVGVAAGFAILGLLVWQVGKSYALFLTMPRASGEATATEFDTERLKSEVLEALDGRLAQMEEDVHETRRAVGELKREEHAAAFDERETVGAESASAATESDPTDAPGAPTGDGPDGSDPTAR